MHVLGLALFGAAIIIVWRFQSRRDIDSNLKLSAQFALATLCAFTAAVTIAKVSWWCGGDPSLLPEHYISLPVMIFAGFGSLLALVTFCVALRIGEPVR